MRAHAQSRGRLALFALLCAAGAEAFSGVRAGTDLAGLARSLGDVAEVEVAPESLRWEPSRGMLGDLVLGRRILFLGAQRGGGARDVFRAKVRLAPNGVPLRVASAVNLTNTPEGDDVGLSLAGQRAAFVTLAYGHVQAVTVLDLDGEGSQNLTEHLHDRAMAALTNLQTTGALAGVARYDITFDEPVARAGLVVTENDVQIAAIGERGAQKVRWDAASGNVVESGAHAQAGKHLPKWLVHWAVDSVRAIPWIGSEPIAWLEERVASLRDRTRRTLHGGSEALQAEKEPEALTTGKPKNTRVWPPQTIHSIWKTPEPQEGEWVVPTSALAKPKPGEPQLFYTTFVRPDEERSYAKVLMVAMDMQELEVGMEAGVEDPKPLTGPPGSGRIPRDPKIYRRVAAAFNGGFKTEHGHYGMVLNHRVLLPPVPGAATLVTLADGRVAMGTWGASAKVAGLKDIQDEDIVSLRQNLDPLVAGDVVNPTGRNLWGFTRDGTGMQTERSGVCVTHAGHLVYAWGDDLNGTTLGKAFKMAGCAYAMHLDMNPHHTGLVFTNIVDFKGKNYRSELLTGKMGISPDRFLEYAPKDFFFVLRRNAGEASELEWKVDGGEQPDPKRPTVMQADMGAVHLQSVAHARFALRAGTGEPTRAPVLRELRQEDAVLLSLPLGLQNEKRPRGLAIEGKPAWFASSDRALAALVIDAEGKLSIADAAPEGTSFVQLPRALRQGEAVATSTKVYDALGVAEDGTLLVASSNQGDGAALSAALVRAGARDAVFVERSARASFLRAGTQAPPRMRNVETTLSALALPPAPMAFVFEALEPYLAPKKK